MLSFANLDKLSVLQSEYPKYTPLLAKILEGVLSRGGDGDIISQNEEVIFPPPVHLMNDFLFFKYHVP